MIELDTIYNEDCLTGMQRIPDGSVDCIICDLPYGTTACKWDSVIPFEPLWEQYKRVTKPNAAIVLFASGMFTSDLMQSNRAMWRYNLIWKKGDTSTGFMNANKMPMRNHEDICVFYDALPTYNPQMRTGYDGYNKSKYNGRSEESDTLGQYLKKRVAKQNNGERYPLSVIDYSRNWRRQDALHPTQKPVDLIAYLIRTYSNPGDTILDNTIGSGTTAVAALREKRHFIGFELNRDYYDIALRRIKLEQQQQTLF